MGKLENNALIELNLEKVFNDKYLKVNDIESPLINNNSKLYSYLSFQNSDQNYLISNILVTKLTLLQCTKSLRKLNKKRF